MKKKSPAGFKAWRKSLRLTQKEAAHLLGLKSRMVQNYESGTHEIPLYIRLAMASLNQGIIDFDDGAYVRPETALPLYAAESLGKAKADAKKIKRAKKDKKAEKSEV